MDDEKNRKLTAAEERRMKHYNELSEKLAAEGYRRTELTVGLVKANLFAVLFAVPLIFAGILLFYRANPGVQITKFTNGELLLFFLCYLVLIVVHELIHGLTWAVFAEDHFKSIEFGFIKEYLTPYCTCCAPLSRGAYVAGSLMPLIVLGLVPAVVAVFSGSALLLSLALVMILAAGGDVLIVLTLFFAIMPLVSFALESVIIQPGNYSLSNMTLNFWIGTEDSAFETGMPAGILVNGTMWWGLIRQVGLAVAVALVVGTCGMLIGYACVRRRGTWLSRAVENLAFFPYLMPAMAFGTIYLAVATSASFKWLYGSFFLLGLVAAVKFLPFASRSGVNSMMQIAPEIEEAATIFGVPWVTRMRRILFPIQKSAIISGYLLPVINVMREVALFTLLVPYPRYLLTTMLFSFNETGYAQYGSAVTLLIIVIIISINSLVNKLTGASFDKGIGG